MYSILKNVFAKFKITITALDLKYENKYTRAFSKVFIFGSD